MIKLKDRWTERPVFINKDAIESLQVQSSGEEVYTQIKMNSGTQHEVSESVGQIIEMKDND